MFKKGERNGLNYLHLDGVNSIVLIIGCTGSGKTVLTDSTAWQMKHLKGYKVIYLTEKPQGCMENAFCGIERNSKKQDKIIISDGMVHDFVIDNEKIEVYHPFTFQFPKNNVPNIMRLFTLPLKKIEEESFCALLGRTSDSPTVKLCTEVKQSMKDYDDMYSFLFKAFEKSTLGQENNIKFVSSAKEDEMGLPIESFGSKDDIELLKHSFKKFQTHFFIQDNKCEMNLTEEKLIEMINDQQTTTFFTMWKIDDRRLIYFLYIELLLKLRKIIKSGKGKYPLLIIIEEIKILLPKKAELKYEVVLINILREILSDIRNSQRGASIIATTQSYYETNMDFRSGISDIILFKLNIEDQKAFSRDFKILAQNENILNKLEPGRFVLKQDLFDKEEIPTKFRAFYVPFAHKEAGYPEFPTYWKYRYPDSVLSHRLEINEMFDKHKKLLKEQMQRSYEFEEKIKQMEDKKKQYEMQKQKEREENKDEIMQRDSIEPPKRKTKLKIPEKLNDNKIMDDDPTINAQIKKYKDEAKPDIKEDINFICYDTAVSTPCATWEDRALLHGLDAETFKKNALQYALQKQDKKFLEKYFPEQTNEQNQQAKEFQEVAV